MSDTALPPLRLGGCREVSPREAHEVLATIEADPLVTAPVGERIAGHGVAGGYGGRLFTRGGPSRSLLFAAGTLLPVRGDRADLTAFALMLAHHGVERVAVHGRRRPVEQLWSVLEEHWGPPREVRDEQVLMALLDRSPVAGPEPALRLATIDEFERVLPVAAAVYAEEMGSDPLSYEGGVPFRRRVARSLARQRTWVLDIDGDIVFKADIGVLAPRVAQIQGVWTAPTHRGRGIGSRCAAALCSELQKERITPTLVVNGFNVAARATYRRVGMVDVADYATVLV